MTRIMNADAKKAALETAQAVIDGQLGIIEGCVRLASLAIDVVPDWRVDEDFVVFGVISDETDHLPIGAARQYWDPKALEEADISIARIENSARDDVIRACKNIIRRLGSA